MLTVNYTDRHGRETIWEVVRVEYLDGHCGVGKGYTPTNGAVHIEFSTPQIVSCDLGVGAESIDTERANKGRCADMWVYSGRVFVMNDNGKTVAKYDLGGWPVKDPNEIRMATVGG